MPRSVWHLCGGPGVTPSVSVVSEGGTRFRKLPLVTGLLAWTILTLVFFAPTH